LCDQFEPEGQRRATNTISTVAIGDLKGLWKLPLTELKALILSTPVCRRAHIDAATTHAIAKRSGSRLRLTARGGKLRSLRCACRSCGETGSRILNRVHHVSDGAEYSDEIIRRLTWIEPLGTTV
jgi:hypothetical protein